MVIQHVVIFEFQLVLEAKLTQICLFCLNNDFQTTGCRHLVPLCAFLLKETFENITLYNNTVSNVDRLIVLLKAKAIKLSKNVLRRFFF